MKSKDWIKLRDGCPSRIKQQWWKGDKTGFQYICGARTNDEYDGKEVLCTFQKKCPFVYWLGRLVYI
jgi:hypothetical protein